MQKLLRRSAQAEKQAIRRNTKRSKLCKNAAQRQDFKKRMVAVRNANSAVEDAKRRRREDWELGPLAPQRDTPIKNDDGAYWGSMTLSRALSDFPKKQVDLACKWAGGSKYLCVKPGDRVAIMQGPDKGKIGTVRSIELDEGSCVLDGEHLRQNYTVSDYLTKAGLGGQDSENPFTQVTPYKVPIQAIRLVHPLRDPATGKVRDVLINELAPSGVIRDKPTGRVTWSRVVPGLNIEIPWPHLFEESERQQLEGMVEEYPCDTLRIDVEEHSFVPTLLRPPMPEKIIDELRNRYSKFRTRHEDEYILKKTREEIKKKLDRGMSVQMMSPRQELNLKLQKEKKARIEPVLSDQMLVKIGQIMAKHEGRRFSPAGSLGLSSVKALGSESQPLSSSPSSSLPPPPPL